MIYQELDSRKINHFLSGFMGLLIVSCESSGSVKPGECSFHDPSKKFGCEVFGSVGCVLTSTDQCLVEWQMGSTSENGQGGIDWSADGISLQVGIDLNGDFNRLPSNSN